MARRARYEPVDLEQLGERAGWRCAICGGAVDRRVGPGAPSAPSVDHVLPRAHGGTDDPANLRLAHRRCNTRRGSAIPELVWPASLGLLQPAPLLSASRRARRRIGRWEVVALAPTPERAGRATAWLREAVTLVLGPGWETRTSPLTGTALHAVELRAVH